MRPFCFRGSSWQFLFESVFKDPIIVFIIRLVNDDEVSQKEGFERLTILFLFFGFLAKSTERASVYDVEFRIVGF
jgi:hypothetical protein